MQLERLAMSDSQLPPSANRHGVLIYTICALTLAWFALGLLFKLPWTYINGGVILGVLLMLVLLNMGRLPGSR